MARFHSECEFNQLFAMAWEHCAGLAAYCARKAYNALGSESRLQIRQSLNALAMRLHRLQGDNEQEWQRSVLAVTESRREAPHRRKVVPS